MAKDSAVTVKTKQLPDSRVQVDAEVSAAELRREVDKTAGKLGRDLKLSGFRKGKVPSGVVIQRLGREYVFDDTVRAAIGRWYSEAVDAAGIAAIGDPEQLEIGDTPKDGEPLTFSFEIGVRPVAKLGEYKGISVEKDEPKADPEALDSQIEELQQRMARLDTVERPAQDADHLVVDYLGSIEGVPFEGGEGRDQLIELGSGRLIPGFEEQLVGSSAGDDVKVELEFPDDYPAENLAGRAAEFAVTVKEVKSKEVPELDDDFAADAAGFDTLDELREDMAVKLREADEQRVEADFREAILDKVVANSKVDVPDHLIDARAKELWERLQHSLSHQGLGPEQYLQITGKTEEELIEESKPDAELALRRESVIAAVVEAEGIEPADGDVMDVLGPVAAQEDTTPEKLLARLEKNGQIDNVREDIAQRQAIDFLAESAKVKGGSKAKPAAKKKAAAAKKPAAKKPAAKK